MTILALINRKGQKPSSFQGAVKGAFYLGANNEHIKEN